MSEIIFLVEEEAEGGFSAKALGHSIFTQGESLEELRENVLDAARCHFPDTAERPRVIRLHWVRDEVLALLSGRETSPARSWFKHLLGWATRFPTRPEVISASRQPAMANTTSRFQPTIR